MFTDFHQHIKTLRSSVYETCSNWIASNHSSISIDFNIEHYNYLTLAWKKFGYSSCFYIQNILSMAGKITQLSNVKWNIRQDKEHWWQIPWDILIHNNSILIKEMRIPHCNPINKKVENSYKNHTWPTKVELHHINGLICMY